MTVVLSTAYFPPVTWFMIAAGEGSRVEKFENYKKQTFRNRCEILSSNGKLSLTVPVLKDHGNKLPITEVCIDNSVPWERIHINAIKSAYGKTPYFIHYFDDIRDIIESGSDTIWELNWKTIKYFTELYGIGLPVYTEDYIKEYPEGTDYRDLINPKCGTDIFSQPEYFQAFSSRFGFVKGLSSLDLLFNLGPDGKNLLF